MKNEEAQKGQKMGLWGAVALVFSGMVGSGILFLPHTMAHCKTWGLFSWFLGAAMTYAIFLSFAGVNKYFIRNIKDVKNPDILDYLQLRYCDTTSFVLTYGHFAAMTITSAVTALALGDYFKGLYPTVILCTKSIGTLSLLSMFLINLISFGAANALNFGLTLTKLLFFSCLSIGGIAFAPSYVPDFGSFLLLFSGAGITMFAFMGIELGILASGSIENPEKNVIEATKLGLIFASIVFLGVYSATLFVLPDLSITKTPVYDAAILLFGSIGAKLIGVVAILSCLTSLNGCLIVQGNALRNFSRKKYLSKFFNHETSQGFPWRGSLLSLIISTVIIWNPYKIDWAILAVTYIGLLYFAMVWLEIILNGWSMTSLLAVISCVIMLCNINLTVALIASSVYFSGYLLKKLTNKSKENGRQK